MPRFAANLSMMFNEHPFPERFGAAATAGFRAVEFLFPYAQRAEDIAARLTEYGLALAIYNTPTGDWEAGERGFAAVPGAEQRFAQDLDRTLAYAEVGAPNLRLHLDLYHTQIMEGDLTRRIRALAPLIRHVQIAGVPDRTEPDRGELNLVHLMNELDRAGYAGWVGCEYRPAAGTLAGLGWLERWRG